MTKRSSAPTSGSSASNNALTRGAARKAPVRPGKIAARDLKTRLIVGRVFGLPADASAVIAADAHPDAELVALVDKRLAARRLTRELDDDDADAVYNEIDRINAQIAATPAATLVGVGLKAVICCETARDDRFFGEERAWPMLSSLMRDLQHVPLDDVKMLRFVFCELAVPLPPRWRPGFAMVSL